MPEQSNDYRVVVFGAGGVGKSSLVLRFVKGTFRESYIPTVEDTYRQVGPSSSLYLFFILLLAVAVAVAVAVHLCAALYSVQCTIHSQINLCIIDDGMTAVVM